MVLGSSGVMLVRDLMQHDVVTLKLTDTLGLADDIMELGRIRHLPVLSGSVVVGIVSQRDLYRAAVSSMLQLPRPAEREWLAQDPRARRDVAERVHDRARRLGARRPSS